MKSPLFRRRNLLIIAVVILVLVIGAAVLFLLSFASGPVILQEGAGYTDAAGRFSAPIPAGWTNESNQQFGQFSKGDTTIYLVAVKAVDVQAGIDAALALVAPTFDRKAASLMNSGDAPAANGVWKENVYQASDGRIYYTDTQVKQDSAILVITTAPSIVSLMKIINDAHAIIVGINFAGDESAEVVVAPTATVTAAPLPTVPVTLPSLTGSYAVGRSVYTWVDNAREETYSADLGDKRALTVWVWYPADPDANAQPTSYLPEAMHTLTASMLAIDTTKIFSHSYANASVSDAQAKYPVLVFSHGNQSNSLFSAAMLEEIASHGYIVFGIDHTYNALLTTLPDGEVIRALEAATPETAETFAVRVADVRFVLDQLESLNGSEGTLAGKLDLQHLGLLGHSYGGATAAESCRVDPRCQSVAVMDVPLRGEVATAGLRQPILLMDSEVLTIDQYLREAEAIIGQPAPFGMKELLATTDAERAAAAAIAIKTSTAGYHLSIQGTRHGSFTDIPFLMQQQPKLQANLGGFASIDAERGWRISSDFLLAFFGKHLRAESETTSLLDGASDDYPEVVFIP